MKVLVLGAHGFIGSHVASGLEAAHDVARADLAPRPGEHKLAPNPRAVDILELIERAAPDAIVNCTGAASVPASLEAPEHDFALNVNVVLQCLEAIRLSGAAIRFAHLSSAAVFGNPASLPVREDAAIAPVSPYGLHKNYAEMLCREYTRFFGVPTISLRIFSAYGPGLRKQLFWDVFQRSLRGGPIRLFGTGEETRDFLYAADVASAIRCALERAAFDGRAINVGSGVETSTRAAVSCLLQKLNARCELVFSGEVRQGDPAHWRADVSTLSALGFAPAYTIETGLGATAEWLNAQR